MPPIDYYDLGAMDEEEIIGVENEETISKKVKEMVEINDSLYRALATYLALVSAGKWTETVLPLAPIGILFYSADDLDHAKWEVENWHTGALKWMTDGAQALREGKVSSQDWGEWGLRLAGSAKEIAARLNDSGLVSRAKSFVSTMPDSFRKTLHAAAKGAGAIARPLLGEIPWWVWAGGGVIAFVFVANAVGNAARAIRGE